MDTVQLEWLNQNSLRAYPFEDDMSRIPVDENGNALDQCLALPNYVITDIVMTVPSGGYSRTYLKNMVYASGVITFIFASADTHETVFTLAVSESDHTENESYRITGTGAFAGGDGAIVIGDISRLKYDIPDGFYTYTPACTTILARCVRPSVRHVSGITVTDSVNTTRTLTGVVNLISGSNIDLDYDEDTNSIIINAADGMGYTEECTCGGVSENVIHYINGVSVDDVTLIGDECINISTSNNVIKISDMCSKPCCGCAELAFINDKISEIQTAISKLDSYVSALDSSSVELRAAVRNGDSLN